MRGLRLIGLAASAAVMLAVFAPSVFGQANNTNNTNNVNNNNNNGNLSNAPAGVIISTDGLLRIKTVKDPLGDLNRTRIAEAKARIGGSLSKGSPLRKISLQRLEAAIAECMAANKPLPDEMKALAGLTRLQY